MKATVHVAIGASAPAGLVLTQGTTLPQGVIMAAVSAGYALLPDLDNNKATATLALGKPVHGVVYELSKWAHRATASPRDLATMRWMVIRKHAKPYHRTLTHTIAASLAIGAVAYLAAVSSALVTACIAAFGVFLMWPLNRKNAVLAPLGAIGVALGSIHLLTPWQMAMAVGGGYLSHVVADSCTKGGVPAFWPIPIKGKRWWNIRLMGRMILSGSRQENIPALGVSLATNALLVFIHF